MESSDLASLVKDNELAEADIVLTVSSSDCRVDNEWILHSAIFIPHVSK